MPARTIKLIYIGVELDDHVTPFACGCVRDTTIHVVRTLDSKLLKQAITPADLLGVCRFCQTRGTKFLFRPQCATCASRSVVDVSCYDHVVVFFVLFICVCLPALHW